MSGGWESAACEELIGLRGGGPAWGERRGDPPRVELTALAALGLLAGGGEADRGAVAQAARWLAGVQGEDGALGVSETLTSPSWPTAHAVLLWSASGTCEPERARATAWLIGQEGVKDFGRSDVVGDDGSIAGWPWVEGTHPWLEPTAMAVLAVRRRGAEGRARADEGLRLIRDRAIESGGWNYGNRSVLGRELRPQPAPTGLALLALAGQGGPSAAIEWAIAYLERVLPGIRAAASLCWGLLGLSAWGRLPAAAGAWLAEAHAQSAGRPDAARRLACLLLASGPRALEALGVEQSRAVPGAPPSRPGDLSESGLSSGGAEHGTP